MIRKIMEVWKTIVEVGTVVGGEKCGDEAEWHIPYPSGNWELTVVCEQVCDQRPFLRIQLGKLYWKRFNLLG